MKTTKEDTIWAHETNDYLPITVTLLHISAQIPPVFLKNSEKFSFFHLSYVIWLLTVTSLPAVSRNSKIL